MGIFFHTLSNHRDEGIQDIFGSRPYGYWLTYIRS